MKINEYNQMMKWLTRPKSKPMEITDYIKKMNYLYGNGNEDDPDTPSQMNPKYIDPLEMQKIKESLPVGPLVKKPKKKEIKKDKDKKWKYTNWLDETKPREATPSQMVELEKRLENARAFTSEPKKIIKKTLIVEKPKTKPVPISPLPYDWREGIWHDLEDEDPYYNWGPKPSEDVRKILNIKKREVAGLEALLNLHKKKHG